MIGIVAGAPSCIKSYGGEQLPFGGIEFPLCIEFLPVGNLDARVVLKSEVHHGFCCHGLCLPCRHRRVDDQFLIHGPEHQVGECHLLILIHIIGIRQVILAVGEVGLHLDHVGVSLLPQLLLPFCLGERLPSHGHLLLIHIAKTLVIHHIVVRLHHGQANVCFNLFLLRIGNQHPRLGNLVVVHRLEAVEEVVPGTHTVVIMERRGVEIGIGLRVDAAAEIVVRVCLSADLWSEQGQGGIATVKLRVTDGRPLNSDFRGVGNGVLHTVVKSHQLCAIVHGRSGALGSLRRRSRFILSACHRGGKSRHRCKNEYVKSCLHYTMIYHRKELNTCRAKLINSLICKCLLFAQMQKKCKALHSGFTLWLYNSFVTPG